MKRRNGAMATIALINPPSETVGTRSRHRASRVLNPPPPLGIASLAAVLREAGHDVTAWDLVAAPLEERRLLEALADAGVDVVGVSVIGPAFFWARAFARDLKEAMPNVFLVAGNALASEYPDWFLAQVPETDCVLVGEAECSFPALLDSGFSRGTPGAAFRENETSRRPARLVEDLDALPYPAWDLLPVERYQTSPQFLFRGKVALSVLQSRGCPWSCSYCAQNYAWEKLRVRSMASVAEELARGYRDSGVECFGMVDSIFPLRKQDGERLYAELERRGLVGKIRFGCETRVDMIWPETFRWLKRAGLHFVMLGIESASEDILDSVGKRTRTYPSRKAAETLCQLGIKTYGLFMIGFPGETPAERQATAEMMLSLPLDMASVGIYSTYAGSPEARARGPKTDPLDLIDTNWEGHGGEPEVVRDQRRMMRQFFLRPRFISRHLVQGDLSTGAMLKGGLALLRHAWG